MFYSTLTLRFDPARGGFDDQPLDDFSRSKELLSVKDHFFEQGGLPHLLLCISWRMPPAGSARQPKPEEDWKTLLSTPEHHDAFDRLRRWRNEAAKKEGKPAYAIFTNRQIAEIAVLPSPSLAAISELGGVGPARVDRYGRTALEVLGKEVAGG